MTKINSGYDIQAAQMGGDVMGATGTSTAVGATSLTDSGAAWTVNAFAYHIVVSGSAYGVIQSNTSTVLTIDRWNTPGSPGGSAASTPSTGVYVILAGAAAAMFIALTANSSAAGATDTSLTGEITTASGGLIRKICPYAHTASATTYTLTPVFTANGSDSLPVTIAKIGVFQTVAGATGKMLFETLLASTATLSTSGDQLTITETVSM